MFKEEVGAPAPRPGMVDRLRQALIRAERRNERNLEIVTQTLGAEAELRHDLGLLSTALDSIMELAEGPWLSPSTADYSAPWWAEEIQIIVKDARAKLLT